GTYTVEVEDDHNCVTTLDINVAEATKADAGAEFGTVCSVNSFPLSANTPAPGETGMWTGPPGVTFSPDASTPNATANNLSPGANVLRWTITDVDGICPGSFDEIEITFFPALNLSTDVTDVTCHGASTGAIDLTVSG